MADDKRKRARIQGGWASSKPKPVIRNPEYFQTAKKELSTESFQFDASAAACASGFVNETVKPKPMIITDSGSYDLSDSENGISKVLLVKNFIAESECQAYFDRFQNEIPWQQKQGKCKVTGDGYLQPRLTAWFGDHEYSYSGITQQPCKEWGSALSDLKARIEDVTQQKFNSMLANFYRDGKDHIPWHTDAQYRLGANPTIASLTFGAVRTFEMRKMLPRGSDDKDYDSVEHIEIPLEAGTLLVMGGAVQDDWQHRVKRDLSCTKPRMNFTFRRVVPPN